MPMQQYALLALGGLTGTAVAALYAFQERLLYHPTMPTRDYVERPSDYAMEYEDIEFTAEDGVQLHAWLITQPNSKEAATFVYFHGNAGNLSHRYVLENVMDAA